MRKHGAGILVVTSVVEVVERFLLPYLEHFAGRSWQVGVATENVERLRGRVPDVVELHEVPFGRNALKLRHYLPSIRTLRDIVNREGYGLVFVHNPIAGWLTRFALRDMRSAGDLRIVYMCHGFHFAPGLPPWRNAMFRFMERQAARWCDVIITINAHDYAAASAWVAPPSARVLQVPGIGVPLDRFRADEDTKRRAMDWRSRLGIAANSHVVCCVGDLMPGKRTADCVSAVAGLQRDDVVLAIAGTGPEEGRLRALAKATGIERRVLFLGHCDDIPGVLAASSALLMPSEREGLPRSVMEAMAMGVPVVGAAARGTRDLVEAGRGWLVPIGDDKALSAAIEEVLSGDGTRERVAAARQFIRHFSVELAMPLVLEAIGEGAV